MLRKISQLNDVINNLRHGISSDLKPYRKILEDINSFKLRSCSDARIKEMAAELKRRAAGGIDADQLLVEAFALVREASRRTLGLYPFDVQVMAGIALHSGKIVEMQTGEGKTLAAVMPAYLNALGGKGVHIFTFNDYLARRDAAWMGPVYEFLGLSTGYVQETMSINERQAAYACHVTYLTAKEAGFDYLRDFLCTEAKDLLHRLFHYAIVDEADSIFIDEARIPLVIAGNVPEAAESPLSLARLVMGFQAGEDYEIDRCNRNVYLTDTGLSRAEQDLKCGNLYAPENLELLTRLNCALLAGVLLERDKDYIVRNGRIELIDEFTGRVAVKRLWPDNLQAAVEAKEGLLPASRRKILGSIALQHFLNLYPRLAGMTGTARPAAAEFNEFYNMNVVVIPTNKPCIRQDHPNLIFTHREAKQQALLREIKRIHKTGRPLLIGTGSVDESEKLAAALKEAGISCRVLNARNDEMEAKIIAQAGEPGAVTVSTNMAGRGVDIKLGGEREQQRAQVVSAGGLYVIGTNLHESRRIDAQLKGRAGRQGDPGESRFFVSLDDELFKAYDLARASNLPAELQDDAIDDPVVRRRVERMQRIVEWYNADLRIQLWKYSFIIEQQRRIIHKKRQDILLDRVQLQLLSNAAAGRYALLRRRLGVKALQKAEKQLTLYHINRCWADYLDYISYVREGIHLVVIGRQNPLDEFHRLAVPAFQEMLERIDKEIVRSFMTVEIGKEGIDMQKEGLSGPSSTWTYLINENPDQFSRLPFLIKAAETAIQGPLFTVQSLMKRFLNKFQKK